MTRTYLLLLAALAGTVIVPVSHAQTPADTASADSIQPVPAKKKGGGLFGKMKKVAASNLVKGIAKGVACNAVPGAAVAAAAAGSSACPMGGIGGTGGPGGVTGAMGGAVGGAIGAAEHSHSALPNGGAVPAMPGMIPGAGAMGGAASMTAPYPGVKLNESAAAKCLGLTVKEVRDVMNPAPDAAAAARAEAVQEKLMRRAQQGVQANDTQACAKMWEPK